MWLWQRQCSYYDSPKLISFIIANSLYSPKVLRASLPIFNSCCDFLFTINGENLIGFSGNGAKPVIYVRALSCLEHIFYKKWSLFLGQCSNKECPFLHIDPEKKMKDCPWYDRGFCRHGEWVSLVRLYIPSHCC